MNHLEPKARASRKGMRSRRAWALPCLAATMLLAVTALTACTQTEPDTDTSRNSIRLTGRVVGNNNAPVAGVAVSLSRTGLTDTTDALGRYVITRRKAADETDDGVLDTLRYSMAGQALARVNVMQWIDTLPDIQVIQRDISGLLDTEGLTATRIEGVLTGDGIDAENPVKAEFYYNPLTGNYSGFLFFPPVSSVAHYSVQINVYGAGDVLIGQSAPVPFNSFAGNITVPAFTAGNSVPRASAGNDTAVAPGATVNLRGTASDAFGGNITKWEWSIAGSAFAQTSGGDTSFSRATPGAYVNVLRVTDDDGNTALDTMIAHMASHGTAWIERSSGTSSPLTGVVWTGTQFVATGHPGSILTSPDGIVWTSRTVQGASAVLTDIVWTGKKLIAIPAAIGFDSLYYTSEDGINWTRGSFPLIIFGPGHGLNLSTADSTVIVSGNHSNFIARSEDHGATWIVDTLPPVLDPLDGPLTGFNAVTRHGGRLVAFGPNGQTASSPGNGTWTRHTSSATYSSPWPPGGVHAYTMLSAISAGTHVVAVGYSTNVMRSVDGINWVAPRRSIPDLETSSQVSLQDVVWTGHTLAAVGNGFIMLSADAGAHWAPLATPNSLTAIAWSGTRLVAVGTNGSIITSP